MPSSVPFSPPQILTPTRIGLLLLGLWLLIACTGSDSDLSTTTSTETTPPTTSQTTTTTPLPGPTSPFGTERYPLIKHTSELGFTVSHPPDWTVTTETENGLVGFQGPPHSLGTADNFNVVVGEIPNIPSHVYFATEEERIRETFPDLTVLEDLNFVSNGIPGRGLSFTTRQQGLEVGFTRVVFWQQGRAFELTYTTEAERILSQAELIGAMVSSFRIN